MDPLTAGLLAFAYFNQFLSTAAGQKLAERNQAIVDSILNALHLHIGADPKETAK